MNESWRTGAWVMSHMRISHCHVYEWVTNHITRMNESCYTYRRVMSHTSRSRVTLWRSHVTHMNVSRTRLPGQQTLRHWGLLRIWMRHVIRMTKSSPTWICHELGCQDGRQSGIEKCCTYEWGTSTHICVKSHAWMIHVTRINSSFRTYVWIILHVLGCQGGRQDPPWVSLQVVSALFSVTWLIHTRDMTDSYAWRASFKWVTFLICIYDVTHLNVWNDAFLCVCRTERLIQINSAR